MKLSQVIEERFAGEATRSSTYLRRNPVASDAPGPGSCLRRQVLTITVPNVDRVTDPALLMRFRRGRELASLLLRTLGEAGLDIVETEVPIQLRNEAGEIVLTGRVDARIALTHREKPPVEVKTMNPNSFERLRTLDDLASDRFTRRYVWQIQTYMLALAEPVGVIVIDDCLGHIRALDVERDSEMQNAIVENACAVMKAVADGVLPDYTTDPTECRSCPFYGSHCMPPGMGAPTDELEVITDPDLEATLARFLELDETAREHAAIRDSLRERFRGRRVLCGEFYISGQSRATTRYDVPPEVRDQYKRTDPEGAWIMDVKRIE